MKDKKKTWMPEHEEIDHHQNIDKQMKYDNRKEQRSEIQKQSSQTLWYPSV